MATIDDAHKLRWALVKSGIAYTASFAIPTFWRQHPEIGSPLGPEIDVGGGFTAQAFTGGVLRWSAATGVEVVTD